jgi:hypothetical protein
MYDIMMEIATNAVGSTRIVCMVVLETKIRFNVVHSNRWYFVDKRIFSKSGIAFMEFSHRREKFTVYELGIADRGGHVKCHYDLCSLQLVL